MKREPYDYQPLIDRLRAVCEEDDRIAALLLYGSRVDGKQDVHSDLDLGLVTTDAALDDVLRTADQLVRRVGEPLFLEDFGDPTVAYAILADGASFELVIVSASELSLERPYRVILDKAGVEQAALARGPREADAAASVEEVRQLIHWFWHDVEHVATALGRGQLLWAHGGLEELRGVVLKLARIAADAPREDEEPYWKVDRELDEPTVAALRDTIVPVDPAAMAEAATALIELYRTLAQPLGAQFGIAYPAELDALISAHVEGG